MGHLGIEQFDSKAVGQETSGAVGNLNSGQFVSVAVERWDIENVGVKH